MTVTRVPEDDLIMDDPAAVAAFDDAGRPGGALWPVYHANAQHLAALLPEGATVVDVFCGSARLLRHLLVGRPDLRAIGVDLSAEMLDVALAGLTDVGVADRVELRHGDASHVDRLVPETVAAVCSTSALHHCPDHQVLVDVLAAIGRLQRRTGSAVSLFDLVRPEDDALLELLPRAHEIRAGRRLPEIFRRDWTESLRAGWSFEEFTAALDLAGLELVSVSADHSQLHWTGTHPPAVGVPWDGGPVDPGDAQRAARLSAGLGMATPSP